LNRGEWIATLDQSEFNSKLQDEQLELEQKQSEYIQVQLDTTLQMRQARDELINLEYGVEEMQIKLDQSQFEPPATIKQAEIDLDKARRAFDQAKQNYQIKLEQNRAKMNEVATERRKSQKEYDEMLVMAQTFQICAQSLEWLYITKDLTGSPSRLGRK
jgi:HlyD family secretion protein